jgi:hypothetical protein
VNLPSTSTAGQKSSQSYVPLKKAKTGGVPQATQAQANNNHSTVETSEGTSSQTSSGPSSQSKSDKREKEEIKPTTPPVVETIE